MGAESAALQILSAGPKRMAKEVVPVGMISNRDDIPIRHDDGWFRRATNDGVDDLSGEPVSADTDAPRDE
jgi:hypothetical protein